MLSSLLHSKRAHRTEHSPFSSTCEDQRSDYLQQDEESGDDPRSLSGELSEEDGNENTPLLPIFSAAQLDSIPVYSLVHSIRSDITSRVDTTLTWDQLRSPQVSSFLVKPILSSLIKGPEKISKGILYSLMANCLQFRKEAQENPQDASVSKTRALLAELLATKLLREFSSRELIDALSYDFYPLQGMLNPNTSVPMNGHISFALTPPRLQPASRISALEISIRAGAKKFLSHSLVIQHLEAIWTGKIVFHSALDHLHRTKTTRKHTINTKTNLMSFHRAATLYDACDASLFKLSRLRVPRYKHIISTVSLAILLILYVMVLVKRSYEVTPLEVVFWIWSFGFMMDEIAGFTEAGVSLYFMSLWNSFDMGIYLLFMVFYILRIVGLIVVDPCRHLTSWSYDILASCAVFLFPRIFSVLDHYRYFSQLIIAFKIMAVDMTALLVLILISCSGFFVAFTFAFARESYSAKDVSYALFQILMGFTPAAWEVWEKYNPLGRILLTAFLIICHFLIVTILITVLTNSFAAVAANSQEEHQFLVAVNTLSLVKSDSLFSYTAPLNLLAWILHPLRFLVPFRQLVKLNRFTIKVTHFPILALIFIYERTVLRGTVFGQAGNFSKRNIPTLISDGVDRFNTGPRRFRGGSVAGSQHQEAVLNEVFRKPYKGSMAMHASKTDLRSVGTNVGVDSWMKDVLSLAGSLTTDEGGIAIQRRALARGRRYSRRGSYPTIEAVRSKYGRHLSQSVISDPEEFTGKPEHQNSLGEGMALVDVMTEDDADDEENSVDEEGINENLVIELPTAELSYTSNPQKYLTASRPEHNVITHPRKLHRTNTQMTTSHTPAALQSSGNELGAEKLQGVLMSGKVSPRSGHGNDAPGESSSGKTALHSPRAQTATRPRSIIPSYKSLQAVLDLNGLDLMDEHGGRRWGLKAREDCSSQNIAMVPSSFATQMALATAGGNDMLGRVLLARIGALEVGMKDIRDILKEIKKLSVKGKEKEKERSQKRFRGREAKMNSEKELKQYKVRAGEIATFLSD